MSTSLFDNAERPQQAARLAPIIRSWADKGVYFGTSSWKYPGWVGSIYTEGRYITRSKFSNKKFEDTCLAEYAQTFPVVGGDFTFYRFPSPDTLTKQLTGTPKGFGFGLKVTEDITVVRWPSHARYGAKAGTDNPNFLDAEVFKERFLKPLEAFKENVPVIMFEFGSFAKKDFAEPEMFFGRLEGFLGSLPKGWRYAVEIRNRDYLEPEYFATLSQHNVAHVINSWTRMPAVGEQIEDEDTFTADFTVVRALLQPGSKYQDSVDAFQPYDRIQEPDPGTRTALRQIADRAVKKKQKAYIFVNNRLEGHAPSTIEAVVSPDAA